MSNQLDDYIADWLAVRRGEKPMMICEFRKCGHAYNFIQENMAIVKRVRVYNLQLADSSGMNHPALVVTQFANRYQNLLTLLGNRALHTRESWQLAIGQLLGYSIKSCADFSQSYIGRTCGCELCGGLTPFTALTSNPESRARQRQLHDEHVRRTMYHA